MQGFHTMTTKTYNQLNNNRQFQTKQSLQEHIEEMTRAISIAAQNTRAHHLNKNQDIDQPYISSTHISIDQISFISCRHELHNKNLKFEGLMD